MLGGETARFGAGLFEGGESFPPWRFFDAFDPKYSHVCGLEMDGIEGYRWME